MVPALTARLFGLLPPLAWLALWLLSRSPYAYVLGHEVLGESRFSPPVATLLFAAGWLLMVVAMMLPGALAGLGRVVRSVGRLGAGQSAAFSAGFLASFVSASAFVSAFLSVWLAFGFAFAFSDLLVHAWLEPRYPEAAALLPGVALLVAGLWQLLSRFMTPTWAQHTPVTWSLSTRAGAVVGWRQGLTCLHSCWALMLAMTAVGDGRLAVMLGFAAAMSVARRRSQVRRRHRQPVDPSPRRRYPSTGPTRFPGAVLSPRPAAVSRMRN